MADFWNDYAASEKKTMAAELPEGTYEALVVSCEVGKTKNGEDKIFWDLKVTKGDQANNHHWIHAKYFKTPANESEQKDTMKMLDYFKALDLPCTRGELQQSMNYIVGKTIEFKIVFGNQGGRFTNFIRIVPTVAANSVSTEVVTDESSFPF